MTAALQAVPAPLHVRPTVTVRPAPRREPPFDDELEILGAAPVGRLDQQLPFAAEPGRRPALFLVRDPSPLPDPSRFGHGLLTGLIEVAAGRRPHQQIARMLSPTISRGLRADLDRRLTEGRPHWIGRAIVRRVRSSSPAEGVAELSATVQSGGRVRAVALRLEDRHGVWCCTRLQWG
jgi:Family of unknown function (DUF6459)